MTWDLTMSTQSLSRREMLCRHRQHGDRGRLLLWREGAQVARCVVAAWHGWGTAVHKTCLAGHYCLPDLATLADLFALASLLTCWLGCTACFM